MADTHEIKCAKCDVPLQGNVVDTKPQDKFSCPRCGVSDTYQNVMREVADYTGEKMAECLGSGFERATRGSKSVTFKKSRRPKKVYRFVVDLGL